MTRVWALAAFVAITAVSCTSPKEFVVGGPQFSAIVILAEGKSFEQLAQVPEVRALSREPVGGMALMSVVGEAGADLGVKLSSRERIVRVPVGRNLGARISKELDDVYTSAVLIVVVGAEQSTPSRDPSGRPLPIVVAWLFPTPGSLGSGHEAFTLTSDSTRRVGLVTQEDVRHTILKYLDLTESEGGGSELRVLHEEPPFELNQRYHAQRRMYVPIGTGAAIAVTLFGIGCVLLIWFRRRGPRLARTLGPWLALATPALAIGLLAAGNLRTLNYATVVPFITGVTIVLPVAALSSRRNGILLPPALLGAAVLVFFVAEALLGWPATLHTFIGGTSLDGARFYGLPNVFIGLLLGSGLYLASVLRPYTGFVLLVGIGLFCGFPSLGANLGGSVTLFAAAGLWLALNTRRGFGIRGLAITGATLVAGTAAALIANALARSATHITNFVEEGGGGVGGLIGTFLDRLGIGWDLLMRNPFAFVPVVGVLVCLGLVLRPPRPIRESFERYPQWRTALLVIVLGSIVAYFVNDTGPAAAGLGFGLAIGGLFYVPLAEEPVKMER